MINYTATYTDQYQLTMSQVYFLKGQKENEAVFDYFFRKLPFDGSVVISFNYKMYCSSHS